jgi:phage baseplate assembly protein V
MAEIDRLNRAVKMASAQGTITSTDDSGEVQLLQVRISPVETRDNTPAIYAYGYSSRPLVGAQAALTSGQGDRSQTVAQATHDGRYRWRNLAAGEVVLSTHEGDSVHFREGRIVAITCGTELRIDCPLVTITGDVRVQGDVIAGTISLRNHRHNDVEFGNDESGPPIP